jgi:hypothetical protein
MYLLAFDDFFTVRGIYDPTILSIEKYVAILRLNLSFIVLRPKNSLSVDYFVFNYLNALDSEDEIANFALQFIGGIVVI